MINGKFVDTYVVSKTPEIHTWLNSKKARKEHRRIFFVKLGHLINDFRQKGRPMRGRAKIIPTVQKPVWTIRLENAEGIRILFTWKIVVKKLEIQLLAVSDKKHFQAELKRSSEHPVHASTLDRLPWDNEEHEFLDLENCTEDELDEFTKKANMKFSKLPQSEQLEGWSDEIFDKRTNRASIYSLNYSNRENSDPLTEDYLLPDVLKLQPNQEILMDPENNKFILEGVAGTGKTTILLYRFVQDIRTFRKNDSFSYSKILFVTHNEDLKSEIQDSLIHFFPSSELAEIKKCIKTVEEVFIEIIDTLPFEVSVNLRDWPIFTKITLFDKKEAKMSRTSFCPTKKLTLHRFRKLFPEKGFDTDLFFEEYRGVLRGYNLSGAERIVSENDYHDIGRRRGRIDKEQRKLFYEIAKGIEKKLTPSLEMNTQKRKWDDLDLCNAVFSAIESKKYLQQIQCLYVDEVQDLSDAEIRTFLHIMDSKDNEVRLAMAGDISQSIQPSSFTWQALSQAIYDILKVKIEKNATLTENYRSTPFLVDCANSILRMQGELDGETTPELQRSFAGENTGDPALVFIGNETQLIEKLSELNLPNAACPMLVRDDAEKKRLEIMLNETNRNFIQTIAKFKGLEKTNMLLWEPEGGSEGILNRRAHPGRGSQARKEEYGNSTALLELRHVFVAFTRARYQMGICCPKNDESYFMKKLIGNEESIIQCEIEHLSKFTSISSIEDHVIFATEFRKKRQWAMAAESYRNAGDEHNYHFCMGRNHIDEGNYLKAVQSFTKALEHFNEDEDAIVDSRASSTDLISEHATFALQTVSKEQRSELMARIIHYAGASLPNEMKARFEAEKNEQRQNWDKAAERYITANDLGRAKFCINKMENNPKKIKFFIDVGDIKKAVETYKIFFFEKYGPIQTLSLALGSAKLIEKFPDWLEPLKKSFQSPDHALAKKCAGNNSAMLQRIETHKKEFIINRKHSTKREEEEAFDILKMIETPEQIEQRTWKHLSSDYRLFEPLLAQKNSVRMFEELKDREKENPSSVNTYWEKWENLLSKRGKKDNQILSFFKQNKIIFTTDANTENNERTDRLLIINWIARFDWYEDQDFADMLPELIPFMDQEKNLLTREMAAFLIHTIRIKFHGLKNITEEQSILSCLITLEHNLNVEMLVMLNSKIYSKKKIRENQKILAKMNSLISKLSPHEFHFLCAIMIKQLQAKSRMEYHLQVVSAMRLPSDQWFHDLSGIPIPKETLKFLKKTSKQVESVMEVTLRFISSELKFASTLFKSGFTNFNRRDTSKNVKAKKNTSKEKTKPQKINVVSTEVEEKQDDKQEKENAEPIIELEISEEEILEVVFDDLNFEDTDEGELITEIYSEDISKILNQNQKGDEHISCIKSHIMGHKSDDVISFVAILRDFSDYVLDPSHEKEIPLIHRFAYILAIQDIIKEVENTDSIMNIHDSTIKEQIRLFKHSNRYEILQSKVQYSQRVF
jgi:hypothetical protein